MVQQLLLPLLKVRCGLIHVLNDSIDGVLLGRDQGRHALQHAPRLQDPALDLPHGPFARAVTGGVHRHGLGDVGLDVLRRRPDACGKALPAGVQLPPPGLLLAGPRSDGQGPLEVGVDLREPVPQRLDHARGVGVVAPSGPGTKHPLVEGLAFLFQHLQLLLDLVRHLSHRTRRVVEVARLLRQFVQLTHTQRRVVYAAADVGRPNIELGLAPQRLAGGGPPGAHEALAVGAQVG
mmetsp:Transcript_72392/g.221657  ORF Transcript_72392/g.221657 Transcript_72392/m.221657 type:complete len:235 (+) Transcript_72392:172-876(+)